jgi:hypothetical protein
MRTRRCPNQRRRQLKALRHRLWTPSVRAERPTAYPTNYEREFRFAAKKINTLAYHTCFGKSLWPLRHIRGDPHAPSVLHGEPPWIGVTTYFWGVWLNCTSQPPVDFRSFSQPVADWDEHHVFGRRRCTQAVRFVFALRREFSLYFARHCQQSRTKVPRLRREHSPLRSRLRATTKRCEKRTKRN